MPSGGYKPIHYMVAYQRGLLNQFEIEGNPALRKVKVPPLPRWARNILGRLFATAFKPVAALLPITPENLWFKAGAAAGLLERMRAFWMHDADRLLASEIPPELYNDPERMMKLVGTEVMLPVYRETYGPGWFKGKSFLEGAADLFEQQMHEIQRRANHLYALAFSRGPKALCEFTEGVRHGMVMFLNESGQFAGSSERIVIYQEMLAACPIIEEMRLARTRKTRRHLHELFTQKLGQNVVGDFKRFTTICDDVGLKLGPRGRPRASAKNT